MTMTTVAIGFRGTVLAGTPGYNLLFFNGFNNGFEISAFMGTITEWVFGTSSAGAPGIGSRFNLHYNWVFLVNNYFIHIKP